MDRAALEEFLAQIDRQIAEGQQMIAKQRAVVANVAGKGTRAAKELLKQFESVQAMILADRDHLLKELANLDDHQGEV
jgi:ERCC4-type nuclease